MLEPFDEELVVLPKDELEVNVVVAAVADGPDDCGPFSTRFPSLPTTTNSSMDSFDSERNMVGLSPRVGIGGVRT